MWDVGDSTNRLLLWGEGKEIKGEGPLGGGGGKPISIRSKEKARRRGKDRARREGHLFTTSGVKICAYQGDEL